MINYGSISQTADYHRGKAKTGHRVLIHGASGAVGQASVQMAKAHGMTVVGTAGTENGLKLVRECGANEVYNHRESNYVKKLQEDEKFDVIIEMLSNVNLQNDLTLLAKNGITVVT